MAQLQEPVMTFSVRDGLATEDSPYVSTAGCDAIGATGVHSFFGILEPLSAHAEIADLAPLILDRLQQELGARRRMTPTAAISSAVEAVNEDLYEYNQGRAEPDRLYYGLTCGISRDDDLYLAQVAPSQVLIGQEGELYAFPGLENWHWSQRSDSKIALEQPLGLHVDIEPDLYHTRIEPGDLVVLASGSLAKVIQREPQDVFLSGDAVAAIEHLQNLADDYNVGNAASAAIAVVESTGAPSRNRDFAVLRRMSDIAASLLPEETAERLRRRAKRHHQNLDSQTDDMHTEEYGWVGDVGDVQDPTDSISSVNAAVSEPAEAATQELDANAWRRYSASDDDQFWDPNLSSEEGPDSEHDLDEYELSDSGDREGKRTLTEILAGAILALSAAVVGVWQLAVNRDRPMDGPREDQDTFGLPRLQRYDNSLQTPDLSGLRRRLPRAPISRFTGVVSIGLVIALAGGLAYSVVTSRQQERVEEFEALINRSVVARQNASQAANPAAAAAFLDSAETNLVDAEEFGMEPERIATERAAITDTRDQVFGIDRLNNLEVLGGIPPAPDGVDPKLFFGNGQLYVFTDALYQFDAEQNQLIRLLSPGDEVGGATVGEMVGAAWGHGSPIAMDGRNLYVYEAATASWTRHELGNFGEAYSGVADISGYIGNLYLLLPGSGQIVRYVDGQFDAAPEDWTAGVAAEELSAARDMIIDGRIYVLTDDGRILNFYRSALDGTIQVEATPGIEDAVALSYQPDRSHMYVADSHDRILRVTKDGQVVQQFMPAEDAPQFENIQHVAVDDALGSAYIMTDDALLHARLPGPPQ